MSRFKSGIVVAAHPLAARAGLSMLRKGGNAVDAAVATALALGTVTPAFCGIGGGGFALVWLAREEKAFFVDYRERAPRAAREDMFTLKSARSVNRNENSVGYKAVAIPGAIAGHSFMLEKYGRLTLSDALQPAIKYARRGFRVSRALAYTWKRSLSKLKRFKSSSVTYLRDGRVFRKGEQIALRDLAASFVSIAKNGAREFYAGRMSERICSDMASHGGLLSRDDLEQIKPVVREPVHGSFREFEVISAPPPSSGGAIILQVLNMLEAYDLKNMGHNSTQALHLQSESLARGYVNGRMHVCDPDFSRVPVDKLISKGFAKVMGSTIELDAASSQVEPSPVPSSPASSTTHFVAVDSDHNMVSMTDSVECWFGSGVVIPETGILMNDTMHDFDPRPNHPNSVAPWKIPMSSMSPTIVMKDGRPFMAAGSAGGPRIVSSTLQSILNVLVFGMSIKEAVTAPRIHVRDSVVELESGVPNVSVIGLRRLGHATKVVRATDPDDTGLYFGGVHAALLGPDGGLEGADPRRDGSALGLC